MFFVILQVQIPVAGASQETRVESHPPPYFVLSSSIPIPTHNPKTLVVLMMITREIKQGSGLAMHGYFGFGCIFNATAIYTT